MIRIIEVKLQAVETHEVNYCGDMDDFNPFEHVTEDTLQRIDYKPHHYEVEIIDEEEDDGGMELADIERDG